MIIIISSITYETIFSHICILLQMITFQIFGKQNLIRFYKKKIFEKFHIHTFTLRLIVGIGSYRIRNNILI